MRRLFATAVLLAAGSARAELGHYTPGASNIRDFILPADGLTLAAYSYWYNAQGGDAFTFAPEVLWVTPWRLGGARIAVDISSSSGVVDVGSFGRGDLFLAPLWLGWETPHVGVSAGYGIYVPVGRFEPGASDNLGSGFWTHQLQGGLALYPWASQRLALVGAITYEIDQTITVNWGVSDYVMLASDLRLELGPTGYSTWYPDGSLHAAGGQLGIAFGQLEMSALYFYEVIARDRARGQSIGVSIAKKI